MPILRTLYLPSIPTFAEIKNRKKVSTSIARLKTATTTTTPTSTPMTVHSETRYSISFLMLFEGWLENCVNAFEFFDSSQMNFFF